MAAAIHTALILLQQFSVLACPSFDGQAIVLRFVDARIWASARRTDEIIANL
jgi:hypothetical protein